MRMTRALPAVAAAVLSLGLLAGCTDAKSGDGSSDAVNAAALTQDTFASTIGDAMIDSGSVHLKMSGTISGQELAAEGDQAIGKTADDSKLALKLQVLGMDAELRLLDQVLYFDLGALTQGKFAKIDLTDTSNPLVAQFGGLAGQADIAAQFETLEGAITGFEKAGEPETIDGVKAQPYVVTLDTQKLADAKNQESAQIPESFTSTFFIGPDNLPRRMIVDVQGQALTLELSKWGEAVSVKKPADDEITEIDLGQFAGAA